MIAIVKGQAEKIDPKKFEKTTEEKTSKAKKKDEEKSEK